MKRTETRSFVQALVGLATCAALTVPALAGDSQGAPPPLTLAFDGKPQQAVVVSERASPGVLEAAEELRAYLSRITGGQFELRTGDGARGIVLGTLTEFPQLELDGPLAMRGPYDGKEAYAIRTERDRLLLVGRTELGVSHAAFRFLESLGCRWFFPAKAWEVGPERPTLAVSLDQTDRPALLARRSNRP